MWRYRFAILGAVALAVFAVACSESDLGITTKVKSRLDTERTVNASKIEVTTQNKVVTLAGTVDGPADKERAVAVARGVEGVMDVVDNLSLTPGASAAMQAAGTGAGAGAPNDTAITEAVKQKIKSQPETAAERIDVDTHQGIVTLSGAVKTPQEKEEVIQIARNTQGVQGVEDKLTVLTVGSS